MVRKHAISAAVILSLSPLLAQATTETSAREMFFAGFDTVPAVRGRAATGSGPEGAAKPRSAGRAADRPGSRIEVSAFPQVSTHPSNFGLRYSVLKVAGLDTVEVSPNARFRHGDRIRIKVQVNSNGYLYMVHQGSSGAWSLMYPALKTEQGANRVVAGKEYIVPDALLRFNAKSGTEKLFLVVTRQPETTLENLIYGRGPGVSLATQLGIDDTIISGLRDAYSREFVREIFEQRAYIVNPSTQPDARIAVDIPLVHQ